MKKFLYQLFASNSESTEDPFDEVVGSKQKKQQKKNGKKHLQHQQQQQQQNQNDEKQQMDQQKINFIVQKMLNCNSDAFNLGETELIPWASMLFDGELMRRYHFDSDIANSIQLLSQLNAIQNRLSSGCTTSNSIGSSSTPTTPTPSSNNLTISIPNNQNNSNHNNNIPSPNNSNTNNNNNNIITNNNSNNKHDFICSNEDVESWTRQQQMYFYQLTDKVRVRLLLVQAPPISDKPMDAVAHSESVPTPTTTLRKLLCPVKRTFSHDEDPRFLTTALVVGPWFLEWDPNTSLCIPRRIIPEAAPYIVHGWQLDHMDLGSVLDAIIPVISQWNSERVYRRETANAQHFVDDLIRSIGFAQSCLDTSSSMRTVDCLSIIRSVGAYDMTTIVDHMTPEMRVMCDFPSLPSVVAVTHHDCSGDGNGNGSDNNNGSSSSSSSSAASTDQDPVTVAETDQHQEHQLSGHNDHMIDDGDGQQKQWHPLQDNTTNHGEEMMMEDDRRNNSGNHTGSSSSAFGSGSACDLEQAQHEQQQQGAMGYVAQGNRTSNSQLDTHAQLDAMYLRIWKACPMFDENYPIEAGFFAMVDRVFWSRHAEKPDDPVYQPLSTSCCPFKDPLGTSAHVRRYFS